MKRLYVVDPVCAQSFGHNLAALRYFVTSAKNSGRFDGVFGYCSTLLSGKAETEGIIPYFHFNYYYMFNIEPDTDVDKLNIMSDRDYMIRSQDDFLGLILREECTSEDTIFLPSADYYGIMGVLAALRNAPENRRPKVVLRMIGVLEYSSRDQDAGELNVTAVIRQGLRDGLPIEIVAETPAYATELSIRLGSITHVVPYPVMYELSPIDAKTPLTVSSLGSGRYDKGFLRLKSIFELVIQKSQNLSVRFVVQNLPKERASPFVKYISELSALPGMLLADSSLSQSRLSEWLRRSRVIVTPYAKDVYALRGSAMLMEALSVGRPVVSERGCGFSSQISYYECGSLCTSDVEYADAIVRHLLMDINEMNARMAQARDRFLYDSNCAYARLW